MRPDADRILDIVTAADNVSQFLHGVTREEFHASRLLQAAVERELGILGEAASHLSPEAHAACPGVPWASIRGLRNILIHAYHALELDELWEIATVDLPKLRDDLLPLLPPKPA